MSAIVPVPGQIKGAPEPIDATCINTIRCLAMDAVQQANSGHPGAPMSLAPVAYTLWQRFMRYDPADPLWLNRDRFVLSNGHASMLLYAMIHLTGIVDIHDEKPTGEPSLPLDQLKRFRQLHSKTPGHPEYEMTVGVETTTGPLGQGVSNAVGMALAGRWLGARYNKPGYEVFNFDVYAICGDGCMMEGIASEAASLGGHQKLNNLCLLYDNNRISIEGHTDLAFTENVADRFKAYGWNVLHVSDANDVGQLAKALEEFKKKATDKPTFIVVDSLIGWGSPHKQDTHAAHGEPLGDEEIKLTKRFYGWPEDAKFLVPDGVYEHFQKGIGARGKKVRDEWHAKFDEYKTKFPELGRELEVMYHRDMPTGWDKEIPVFPADAKGMASRESSGKVLNAIAKNVPWVIGGSADLAPSTKTLLTFEGAGQMQAATPGGRNMHFGVREHAMGGIMNGMATTKVRPYGAGFLIFSDYGRGSIRLASIMKLPVLYIFTHDSIGVGEDGPTHEPIEQLLSLRVIPNLIVIRPGDANEVAEAYRVAMQAKHNPVILALSRQAMPTLDRTKYAPASGLAKGAYTLIDAPGGKPDVILIGTGTEVQLCTAAYDQLSAAGIKARVVSMPSWELFDKQPQEYRDSVLPPSVTARVSVEMSAAMGWERYVGLTGAIVGMRSFGESAPLKDLLKHFGFTVEAVVEAAKKQVGK